MERSHSKFESWKTYQTKGYVYLDLNYISVVGTWKWQGTFCACCWCLELICLISCCLLSKTNNFLLFIMSDVLVMLFVGELTKFHKDLKHDGLTMPLKSFCPLCTNSTKSHTAISTKSLHRGLELSFNIVQRLERDSTTWCSKKLWSKLI